MTWLFIDRIAPLIKAYASKYMNFGMEIPIKFFYGCSDINSVIYLSCQSNEEKH